MNSTPVTWGAFGLYLTHPNGLGQIDFHSWARFASNDEATEAAVWLNSRALGGFKARKRAKGSGVRVKSYPGQPVTITAVEFIEARGVNPKAPVTSAHRYECANCTGEITVADNISGGLITVNVGGHAKAAHRVCPTGTSVTESVEAT